MVYINYILEWLDFCEHIVLFNLMHKYTAHMNTLLVCFIKVSKTEFGYSCSYKDARAFIYHSF